MFNKKITLQIDSSPFSLGPSRALPHLLRYLTWLVSHQHYTTHTKSLKKKKHLHHFANFSPCHFNASWLKYLQGERWWKTTTRTKIASVSREWTSFSGLSGPRFTSLMTAFILAAPERLFNASPPWMIDSSSFLHVALVCPFVQKHKAHKVICRGGSAQLLRALLSSRYTSAPLIPLTSVVDVECVWLCVYHCCFA